MYLVRGDTNHGEGGSCQVPELRFSRADLATWPPISGLLPVLIGQVLVLGIYTVAHCLFILLHSNTSTLREDSPLQYAL
jgi:hypothetical protein